jgi:hypothetical protein
VTRAALIRVLKVDSRQSVRATRPLADHPADDDALAVADRIFEEVEDLGLERDQRPLRRSSGRTVSSVKSSKE